MSKIGPMGAWFYEV